MKKLFALLLTLAMALSLAACGGNGAGTSQPADGGADGAGTSQPAGDGASAVDYSAMTIDELKPLLKTVTEGTLTVATSPDFAPYEFYIIDENGEAQLAGFDMAMAQYIADYLGLTLEVIPMDFDGTIMELQQKNVDLGMAGYSPDPDRLESMDFSDIYLSGGQSFVCLQSNKDQFPSLEAANNPDFQIGAQVGSIQAGFAEEYTPDADVILLAKVPDILAELLSGHLDGAFMETMVAESYASSYPDLCVVLDVPYESKGNVVGVSKGNAPLLAAVNQAMASAMEDGSFDKYVAEAIEQASGEHAILVDGEIVPD